MRYTTYNTANDREKNEILFRDAEHERFCLQSLEKCRWYDVYHEALVYCLGIDRDTREHIDRIYDFKSGDVKPECLHEGYVLACIFNAPTMIDTYYQAEVSHDMYGQ